MSEAVFDLAEREVGENAALCQQCQQFSESVKCRAVDNYKAVCEGCSNV